ncbi:MAG TPA: hypothetical protein VJM82_07470 [Nitrospiraceae bacterium]|nr:hypothetical protein [Nitrospiraceae bacterium]
MKGRLSDRLSIVLVAACAVFLGTVGITLAAGTWVDEITNSLTFYKASYPASNFDPYFEKLAKVRDGLNREDQQIVKVEMDQFLKMLLTRAYGINEVAADELYNFALSVRPTEPLNASAVMSGIEIGVGTERPMAVQDHLRNTRDDGQTPCVGFAGTGCDYWEDDMADYTGG